MARYTGSVCRLCRREHQKLFLKGTKCTTDKCPVSKREYSPGQHGQSRNQRKLSDYGLQLREKQKVKRMFGLLERQFRLYFKRAAKAKGMTGNVLLQSLERRLDSVIYRTGFASSRAHARQMVLHGYVRVNGGRVNIPSYPVKENDKLEIKGGDEVLKRTRDTFETVKDRGIPAWLTVEPASLAIQVNRLPTREEIQLPVQEQLIIELYSK